MMHQVPQSGLTALAVAGPVERVVRRHSPRCINGFQLEAPAIAKREWLFDVLSDAPKNS
jgi:hypothetical protein